MEKDPPKRKIQIDTEAASRIVIHELNSNKSLDEEKLNKKLKFK